VPESANVRACLNDRCNKAIRQPENQRVTFKQGNLYKLTFVHHADICSVTKPESKSAQTKAFQELSP
jgi:hypothetical protein